MRTYVCVLMCVCVCVCICVCYFVCALVCVCAWGCTAKSSLSDFPEREKESEEEAQGAIERGIGLED